ncbi:MAG: hypothetical protein ACOWWO_16420 [Peptococcaceae bacterium]
MKKITEFAWVIEKERVLKIINCRPKSPAYHETSELYDCFSKNIKDFLNPWGVYRFIDIPPNFQFGEVVDCCKIVLCFLTLGEQVDSKIKEYLAQSEFLAAMVLEVIADELLFIMTEQLYCRALAEAGENGWNLTERMEPGSQKVPLYLQKDIFANLDLEKTGISLSTAHMLKPLKSITFFCGAGETVSPTSTGHNCVNCRMEKCMFKCET